MDTIDNIQGLALELSAEAPFGIQQLITGAVVIWNVPVTVADNLEALIKSELMQIDHATARVLQMRNLSQESSAYITHFEKVLTNEARSCNMRFSAKYDGPDLKKPIPGILTTKREIGMLLKKVAERAIEKAKQDVPDDYRPDPSKPVMVSIVTHYCKIIGKFAGYQMVFTIIPQRKEYVAWLDQYMPIAVANIVMRKLSTKDTQINYQVNAAGKPYLIRVGRVADEIIARGLSAKRIAARL